MASTDVIEVVKLSFCVTTFLVMLSEESKFVGDR